MLTNPLATVAVLSLSWAAPAPTSVKDPAELLPANTLAYAELRQPGKLVKEFADLFEGSVLANVPDSFARLLPPGQKLPRRGHSEFAALGGFGLILSPEVIKEMQRIQGMAIALTGFKGGEPEWLAVVLPGESNAPAFVMRAVLSTAPVLPAGEVEGVKLYRVVLGGSSSIRKGGPGPRPPRVKPPTARPRQEFLAPPDVREVVVFGPTVAMTPGALFIGSPDAVKDAIRRTRGGKGAALAGNKTFREARREIGNHPGLFAYAEPAPLMEVFEKALKGIKGRGPGIGREETAALGAIREFVNFKVFRSVAYGLTLDRGTLRLSKLALLNPDEKSPLLEMMPSQPVKTALFQFTPDHAVLAAALSNDNGQERWNRIVKLLDAVAKLGGNRGKVPSEAIAEVEKALGVNLGKDIFGKITSASFALGNPLGAGFGEAPARKEVPVVFVLQTGSAEDAKSLLELAPKVFALATGKQPEAVVKEVGGRKVYLLGGEGGLCYGQQGSTIVLGPFTRPVTQALANGAGKKGWLSDAKLAARVEKGDAPIMLAVARPFTLLMSLAVRQETRSAPAREAPQPLPGPGKRPAPPQARAVVPRGAAQFQQPRTEEDQVKKEMAKLLEKEGLLIIRVTRKPDRILAETMLTDLKPIVGRLVDFVLLYYLKSSPPAAPQPGATPTAPKDVPVPPAK